MSDQIENMMKVEGHRWKLPKKLWCFRFKKGKKLWFDLIVYSAKIFVYSLKELRVVNNKYTKEAKDLRG